MTGGFAAAAHREPIAGSISSRLSFQLSRLLNVLLQPEPLHRSSFSSSSMLLCERVALPACVVSSLQVWHTLRILALLASASIIVALGRVSASHTAVHMPPARWFSRGALGWPLCSHPLHRKRHQVRGRTSQLDLSLPSLAHPCCCRRKTAVQLQTVPLPTLVIVYAQLLSGCVAVLSERVASRAVLVLVQLAVSHPLSQGSPGRNDYRCSTSTFSCSRSPP